MVIRYPIADEPVRLTAEQRARIPSFLAESTARAWSTTPLTDTEWQAWETGMRSCYQLAGRPWPGVVVRVGSPMVAALAATIALSVLPRLRRRTKPPGPAAIDTVVTSVLGSTIDPRFHPAVHTAVCSAVRGALEAFPDGHPRTRTRKPVWVDLPSAPRPNVLQAAVGKRVYRAVCAGLCLPLQHAVDLGIDLTVDRAIATSVPGQWRPEMILRSYAWARFGAFVRDEVKPPPDDPVWQASRAHQNAHLTRWWWPTRDFVMVCDRPDELHTEPVADRYQLHNNAGPAIRWADGWALHFWHGTRVPADLIEPGWDVERILAEPNTEIRRCAIERMGWDRFATAAELQLLDQAPDPANPGQRLYLYDVPSQVLGQQTRVLVCTNATRENDGTRHRFGLTVPADCRTALAAAAWTFDVPEPDYAILVRAT